MSLITLWIAKRVEPEELTECKEIGLADNDFLPIYLGYFFVSLSIENNITMIILYAIVFMFTFLSQTQYFNPIFLLFGYHYYYVLTPRGFKIFVIAHGPIKRNETNVQFENLRRLNDTTFIEKFGLFSCKHSSCDFVDFLQFFQLIIDFSPILMYNTNTKQGKQMSAICGRDLAWRTTWRIKAKEKKQEN